MRAAIVDRLADDVPRLMAEHDIPGMAVGICDRAQILWSGAFGTTRRGGGQPISTATMFSVQSTSKMFTATAVMVAAQQGLVDLDSPVTRYLPEFTVRSPWESRPEQRITLRHLLSHTAGLTHEAPLGGNLDDRDSSFDEHCRSISKTWLRFPVGHHFEYSNLGIDLAAYVLQRVYAEPFPEVSRRTLLDPLGLSRTTYDLATILGDTDRAVGHWTAADDDLPVRIPMVGAGGLYTCVDDALRYLQFHLNSGSGVLRADVLEQMYEVPGRRPGQRFGYALGVDLGLAGHGFRNHGGGGFGFLSDLAWDPDSGIGVVVLTNSADHPLNARFAADLLHELSGRGEPSVDVPSPVAIDAEAVRAMTGQYIGRNGSVVRVSLDAGELTMDRDGALMRLQTVGANQVITEGESPERFIFTDAKQSPQPAYLINVDDGFTRYRNDLPILRDSAIDRYTVEYCGRPAATITVRRSRHAATIEGEGIWLTFPPLRLVEHAPGLYFDSRGETLDLTSDSPTYANIPLHPEG